MKILKYIFFAVIGLILLGLVVSFFIPKTFHAEGSIQIRKPVDEVFDYVKLISNQQNYGVWFRLDPKIQKTSKGEDGTVGYIYEWESKKVGNGKQVITGIQEGKRVDMDLFFDGQEDAAKSYISTEAIDSNTTQVVWAIDGEMPIPYNLMNLFYDMNQDFIQGVQNLKEVLEK